VEENLLEDCCMTDKKVWFITGCSTGFGRELAKMVLDRGFRAVVTARDPAKVEDIAGHHGDRALVLQLDVTDPVEIEAAVSSASRRSGE
jgi:NAD(P)-dependent dehydrogenase (short-subunit alcohol dehydrogenase family)